jgi:putative flippase GtrA
VNLLSQKSKQQFGRFLLVGGFNTVFNYLLFAVLNWSFDGLGSYSYMYAAVLAGFISITVSFLMYKWFVFRTSGNYLVEWIRCFGVYGTSALITLGGLPIVVTILRRIMHRPELAPYVGGAIMTAVTVLFSFVGHRNFSFRRAISTGASKERPQ